jgi:hypothetical protein
MLNAVVVLEQDRWVPSANLIGQDLSGAHVVVFIEVNGEARCLGMEKQREGRDQPNRAEP